MSASGDITVAGSLVQGKVYTAHVRVTADDVTIRDSVFLRGITIEAPADRVLVEWSEVVGGMSIASVRTATVRNTEIRSGSDLIHLTSDRGFKASNVLIDTVWAHDPTAQLPAHVDGIQVRGVDGLTIANSSFDLGTFQESENAAIFLENANGDNVNVSIVNNYLRGGGYTFRAGSGGHPGLVVVGNRFGPRHWGDGLFTWVTPRRSVDNLVLTTGSIATGFPVIP